MRYEKGRKDVSRRRIMAVAGERFRQDGIAASGLAGIMTEAGLTNGAFYPHFRSKADLVRECVAEALAAQSVRIEERLAEDGLEDVIDAYLSPQHRDNAAKGCASAALLPELGRAPLKARRLYAERMLATVRGLAAALPADTEDREGVALGLYATLIGAVQLARATKGTTLSDRALAAGAEAARVLVRAGREGKPS